MMKIKTLNMIGAAVLLEVARDPSRGHQHGTSHHGYYAMVPAMQQLALFHSAPQHPALLHCYIATLLHCIGVHCCVHCCIGALSLNLRGHQQCSLPFSLPSTSCHASLLCYIAMLHCCVEPQLERPSAMLQVALFHNILLNEQCS